MSEQPEKPPPKIPEEIPEDVPEVEADLIEAGPAPIPLVPPPPSLPRDAAEQPVPAAVPAPEPLALSAPEAPVSEPPPILSASGLCKSYRRRQVVREVSFEVKAGEVVGLLGPNGAGKTTCFRMAVGMLRPDAGRVLLGGADVTGLPMHRRARLGLGYLPQEPSVFRKLTVRENLLAILELIEPSPPAREARASELIAEFNLGAVETNLGEALSGGERRRVEIARSLITSPRFMLFDEPFAGVDPLAVAELQALIGSLRTRGLGVLISDHNARETLAICDRAYLIAEGAILESGIPQEIARSPKARAVYLGESFRLD